jgi:hypothetical protein
MQSQRYNLFLWMFFFMNLCYLLDSGDEILVRVIELHPVAWPATRVAISFDVPPCVILTVDSMSSLGSRIATVITREGEEHDHKRVGNCYFVTTLLGTVLRVTNSVSHVFLSNLFESFSIVSCSPFVHFLLVLVPPLRNLLDPFFSVCVIPLLFLLLEFLCVFAR